MTTRVIVFTYLTVHLYALPLPTQPPQNKSGSFDPSPTNPSLVPLALIYS
jgi:hypothetical protein